MRRARACDLGGEGCGIAGCIGHLAECLVAAHQVERGGVDAYADGGVAFFHAHEGRHRNIHALGPDAKRFAAPLPRDAQVGAERAQRSRRRSGQGMNG